MHTLFAVAVASLNPTLVFPNYIPTATESVWHFVVNIFWSGLVSNVGCVCAQARGVDALRVLCHRYDSMDRLIGAIVLWAGLLVFVLVTGVVDQLLWRGPMSIWGERCKMS